jgi:hypothetical protein
MLKSVCVCPKCKFEHTEEGFGEVTCLACHYAECWGGVKPGSWDTSTGKSPGYQWSLVEQECFEGERKLGWFLYKDGTLLAIASTYGTGYSIRCFYPRLRTLIAKDLRDVATQLIAPLNPNQNRYIYPCV